MLQVRDPSLAKFWGEDASTELYGEIWPLAVGSGMIDLIAPGRTVAVPVVSN